MRFLGGEYSTGRKRGEAAVSIEWSAPRPLCIAGGFTEYDEHAVQQMNPQMVADRLRQGPATRPSRRCWRKAKGPLQDLYEELHAYLLAPGDDVQEKTLKYYVAFKRIQNFACVELHPSKGNLPAFVKASPDDIELEDGFTRDVRDVSHYGTGDLEVILRSRGDFEKAKHLFQVSYEAS